MANILKNVFIFVAGAAAGYATASYLLNDKYEKKYRQIADEEIASTHESLSNVTKIVDSPKEKSELNKNKPDIISYANTLSKTDYSGHHVNYTDIESASEDDSDDEEVEYIEDEETDRIVYEVPKVNPNKRPYVINPEDFGENPVFSRECLLYYIDGIMANEQDEVVEDVDFTVGIENLEHFGEFETDALFIRNDNLRTDYEIYLDKRSFKEITGSGE